MLIALTHNLQLDSRDEDEAEFDRPETIAFLVEELRALGHEVEPVEVGGPLEATVARLRGLAPDLVFNTAEGRRGRAREGLWPAIFEELGLPHTGSDAFACVLTLDKRLSKRLVAAEGVPTPGAQLVERLGQLDFEAVEYPAFVKPNFEGSSKGIAGDSIVESRARLEAKVATMLARYPEGVLIERFIGGRDLTVPWLEGAAPATGGVLPAAEYRFDRPSRFGDAQIYDYDLKQLASDSVHVQALVEAYLPGREFTVGLLGERRPRVLPAMEIVFTDRAVTHPVYGYGQKKETEQGVRFEVPTRVDEALERELRRVARRSFEALGCRDVARVDLRLDEHGRVHFIECNPLPGLSPGFSDLCVVAEAAGLRYHELIAAILEPALRRLRAARRGRTSREQHGRAGQERPEPEPAPGEPEPRELARPSASPGRARAEHAQSSHEAAP